MLNGPLTLPDRPYPPQDSHIRQPSATSPPRHDYSPRGTAARIPRLPGARRRATAQRRLCAGHCGAWLAGRCGPALRCACACRGNAGRAGHRRRPRVPPALRANRGPRPRFPTGGRGASGESRAPAYCGAKSGCARHGATLRKPGVPRSGEPDSSGLHPATGRTGANSTAQRRATERARGTAARDTETLTKPFRTWGREPSGSPIRLTYYGTKWGWAWAGATRAALGHNRVE